MNDRLMSFVMTDAEQAIKPNDSLEDRLRCAMKAAHNHWMVTDENDQLRGAVAAVIHLSADQGEKDRLTKEFRALGVMSAAMSGVPIDWTQVEMPANAVGILSLWDETA